MKNKTVYKAIILIELFLLTSPLMSTDPNYLQKFLRKPIFTFLPIAEQEDIKEFIKFKIEQFKEDFQKNSPKFKEMVNSIDPEEYCDKALSFFPTSGKVLRLVSSKAIQHELKERGVSRENRRIADYLTNGVFLVFTYLPAKESGKVAKQIVGIIAKQVAVNETYHYVVDKFELDYPEFIKERPYLHKTAQMVCPFIVKQGMYTVLDSLVSKFEDPAGMKNHYKNVYK